MSFLVRFRGYWILAIAAMIFAVFVFISIQKMLGEKGAIAISGEHDIVWATTRAEVALHQFSVSLTDVAREDGPASVEEVNQRYETLLKTLGALQAGDFARALRAVPGTQKNVEAIARTLTALEPQLALLRKGDRVQSDRVRNELQGVTSSFALLANDVKDYASTLDQTRIERVKNVYSSLAFYFIGILVSGTILVLLLFYGVQRARRLLDERERTEDRLRESETRFRDFASSASDWLWDTDDRLRFTYFSKGYLERVGANAIAILGKTFEEIAVVQGDEEKWAEFRDLLARRQPFREFRFRLRTDGASVRFLKVSGIPVFDAEGGLAGYRGTGTDITEQVEAEGEANRVRTLLEEAVEALAEGFIIMDPQDRFVLANGKYRNLYPQLADLLVPGKSFEDIVRQAVARDAIVIPAGQDPEDWIAERMRHHRTPGHAATEQRLKDGRWVQINEQVLANGWYVGTRVDITQLKQREQALTREALIWEQMYDGVIITDLDGRITNWNPASESVFGYPAAEMLGRSPDMLRAPAAGQGHTAHVLDTLKRDGSWSGEFDFVRKDGTEGICQTVVAPLRTDDGAIIAAIWVNQDITVRKRSEEALRAAKEQAESASIAKSRFLATMSHEIRTPMNGVLGMLDLVRDSALNDEQQSYVETARNSAQALLVIIDDVLDFSKMEAGKLSLEITTLDIRDVLEGVLGLLSIQAQSKGIEVAAVIEPNVPTRLRGDPGRLRQIMLNLVGNAVKFTEAGGVGITIAAESATAERARIRFEIMDTGVGIPQARQTDMFGEFTQADPSTTRRFGGTGLGLAISKKLVELMGGAIGFSSTPGKGSTFWFVVDLERQKGAAEPAEEWDARIQGRRILVVEDNPMSGRILARRLAVRGQHVELARTGAEALSLLSVAADQNRPHEITIIDMALPDMAGEKLAERIRANPRLGAPKLVLATLAADRVATERVRAAGFDGHLTKPIRQRALSDTVASILGYAVAAAPSPSEIGQRAAAANAPRADGRPRARLLLAEDSKINQVVAIAMLSKSGYQIDAVDNGREALEAVQARAYDLVLMDVSMPEMDGLDASRAIRALSGDVRRIPIIAMTAHAMESDREKCLAAGMNDYVTKPVDRPKLLEAVARWLGTTAEATPAGPTRPAAPRIHPPRRAPPPPAPVLRPLAPRGAQASPARPAAAPSNGQTAKANPPADTAMPTATLVLDGEILRQLERDTNSAILHELVSTFVAELAERLQRMSAAARIGDIPTLQREAHSLKSSSGTFGALQLQAQARAIEMACREGRTTEVGPLVRPVNAMALDASRALAAWVGPSGDHAAAPR